MFSSVKNTSNVLIYSIFTLSILIFIFFPTNKEDFSLVMGANRYVFSISCWLIVLSLYLLKVKTESFYHKPLLFLGEISYGLYLFHPIVYSILKFSFGFVGIVIPSFIFLLISAILSIIVSFISYEFFEKRIVKLTNNFLNN